MARVKFSTNDGRDTVGEAQIHHYTSAQRLQRAMKLIAIFWAIAIACVFIPILHFVLVPSFLIIGIAMFIRTYAITEWIEFAVTHCPACSQELRLPEMDRKPHLKVLCQNCRYQLRLEFV